MRNGAFIEVRLPNLELRSMTDLDQALYLLQNKTRRQILERLAREPPTYATVQMIGVSQPAVVKHLKELEKAAWFPKTSALRKGGPPQPSTVEQAMSIRSISGRICSDARSENSQLVAR